MDPVSVALIALVGLALMWLVLRAFSNSRHSPTRKVRGNVIRSPEGTCTTLAPQGITPNRRGQDEGTIG